MKVIVIGGGAAGMMAAIHAGELQNEVTLIEKNEGEWQEYCNSDDKQKFEEQKYFYSL